MTICIQVIDVFVPYDMKLIVDSFLYHFFNFLHVEAEKDPMEGTFGSPLDGFGSILHLICRTFFSLDICIT